MIFTKGSFSIRLLFAFLLGFFCYRILDGNGEKVKDEVTKRMFKESKHIS